MQKELPGTIGILGVNLVGSESGNAANCNGRDIPWLQDTAQDNVWGLWAPTYRDVVVLDADNVPVAVYNLTDHDLSNATNYNELKNILLGVPLPPP